MEGTFLEPIHAFGFGGPRGPGRPCQLGCVSEATTVYGTGKVLAFYSEERSPPLQFTTGNANVEAITAVVVSPSGKLVAACEKVRGAGQVTIYDCRSHQKVKTLQTAYMGDFTACAFSPDGESLVTVANDEAATLTCWNLPKSKVICSASVGSDIVRVSFNKKEPTELATTGARVFKLWRWNDKGLKAVSVAGMAPPPRSLGATHRQSSAASTPRSATMNRTPATQKLLPDYTDHAWLVDGMLAVANRDGTVFLIAEGQVQQRLNHNGPIYCLAATAHGFLAGSVLGRLLRYQAPVQDAPSGEWTKQELPAGRGQAPLSCIALDPAEACAKVVLEGESVLSVSLTAMDAEQDASKFFTPMLTGFHSGDVVGLDVCPRRCLLASVSADQSLRLWDYKNWTADLVHTLEEEPRAVAFNPWGYQLLVALPQRVLVYYVLVNKLQVTAELALRDCTKLKYSPSGHLAAAATPRELTVYSALDWTPLAAFKGHSKPVSSLCWSADSLYLVSADAHGTMYSWSMERLARAEESVIKGSDYTCVLYNHDRTALVACGASTPLRVFDTGKQLAAAEAAQPGPDPSPAAASASIGGKTSAEALQRAGSALGSRNGERGRAGPLVAVSPIIRTNIVSEHFGGHSATVWMAGLFSRALLATGARNGALSLRQYPLASDGSRASPELFLHGGPLTGLCCVEAAGLVFSAGVDGIVFVAAVAGHREAASNQAAEAAAAPLGVGEEAPTDTLVMVKKSMLQEEEREREELRWGLQKLSDEAAYKLHRVEQDAAARLREHDEARERAEMGLRQRVKEHEKAAIEAEERYQTTLAAERQHKEEAVKETQQRGDIKLLREARRADGLEAELGVLRRELEARVAVKLAEHHATTEGVLAQHRAYEAKLLAEIDKLHREAASKLRKAETQLVEEFEINEEELHNVMTRARSDYEAQVQRTFEARGQAIFERNKANEAESRKIRLEQEVRERQEQARKLELENAVLRDKIGVLEAHRRDTDQLLLEKEDEILRMRKTIGEHEAYAMIRDTKIRKLESTEEPLKAENAAQKQKLAEAEEREAAFAAEFWTWQEAQRFLKAKVAAQEREMEGLRGAVHAKERYIDLFTADLCTVVRDQDSSEWPRCIKALYAAYVDDNRSAAVAEARVADDEILRQKRCLERFVKVLKDTIARTEEKTRADMERIRGENVVLLGNLADTGRKMATLQALLRQQQARVAHSRAIQRQLTQKLRDLDPTAAHGTARGGAAAWGTGGGGLDDLEGADSLENEESLPEQGASEWGQWAGRADAKALGRTSELQKASPEKALSELANPLPLPRLPHFGPPPVRGASAASASAGQPDKDRHKRPTVAPRRLTSTPGAGQESMIVRPATAMAPPVSPTAQVDWRPATAAAQERPLETSVSESNLAPAKNFAGRLAKLGQSPSFGRLAMGPALVNPGLASAVSQGDVGSSRIGEEEQNERNNAFRRATSLRRKSSQNADKSIADLEVQNAMPMRKVASSRQSLDSTDSEVQNAMSTRESATSRQSIESTESR